MKYRFRPVVHRLGKPINLKPQDKRETAVLQVGICIGSLGKSMEQITYAAVHRLDEAGNDCGAATVILNEEPTS